MADPVKKLLEPIVSTAKDAVESGVKYLKDLYGYEVGTIGQRDEAYPIEEVEQWCNIGVYKFVYRAETEKSLKNSVGNIRLPLPLQLQTQYQQQWNNYENLASLVIGSMNSANIGDIAKNLALTEEAAAIIGGLGGKLVGDKSAIAGLVSAPQISQGLGALGGVSANKFETVTYQKPELRPHQFSWNLTAKSREEGQAIQNIIQKLKYHSHPGGGDGAYFEYPEIFVIKFFSDENLFTIGPSIMENFSVDYHASGRPLYQATDRMPINVSITCSFKETAALTKKLIKDERR
jgi:hypothetical protein